MTRVSIGLTNASAQFEGSNPHMQVGTHHLDQKTN